MHLKATCAPHYYRIMRECAHAGDGGLEVNLQNFGMDAMTRGCLLWRDWFCFAISHVGCGSALRLFAARLRQCAAKALPANLALKRLVF